MYITLKLLQNVSSKKKLYVIEGKKLCFSHFETIRKHFK